MIAQHTFSHQFESGVIRLDRHFFQQSTLQVAQQLLGKVLVWNHFKGIITETEAYIGQDDPACHAARGKTKRTAIMFGPAGYAYVYLIYGIYHCLNIVTESEDFPAAVLIRGCALVSPETQNADGPGKLCRAMGITRQDHGRDVTASEQHYIQDVGSQPLFETTPRIGISEGTDLLWRFKMKTAL